VAWCEGQKKQFVLIPERAEIVRRIFKESASGVRHMSIAGRHHEPGGAGVLPTPQLREW
jgi:hypothetical protein